MCSVADGMAAAPGAGVRSECASTEVKLRHAEAAYLNDIEQCLRCIHDGESYEVWAVGFWSGLHGTVLMSACVCGRRGCWGKLGR